MSYYTTTKIDKKKATYNVIFGERSNGKTYALLLKGLKEYVKNGSQMGYVRRWKEDITGRRASNLFAGLNTNKEVEKLTNGAFTGVHYWAGKFYLCNYTEAGKPIYADSDIIAYTFALSDGEHDKSTSFPNIKLIIFDEFLTNRTYLNDEFVLFMNTVSTIVRRREDVKIYMLGNTVNKYCPYFIEMGLEHVKKMEQGAIDLYNYGDSSLTVAVEYCKSAQSHNKTTNSKYFAFDNPKLQMITGGAWELSIYPHLPVKFKPKEIIFTFFIEFSDNIYQCEVINQVNILFMYIHLKTTPLKKTDKDLIYSLECNPQYNYNRSVFKPVNRAQKNVLGLFKNDKVYYQNNNVGDAINNYLKIAKGI